MDGRRGDTEVPLHVGFGGGPLTRVVAVTHLNKGGGGGNQTALNRFSGSIAFIAAARAAFAVPEDPENDERRFLLQAKNNLGPKCKGLVFRLEQRAVSEGIVSSNIIFTQYVVKDPEIGKPINSENCSEAADGVARESVKSCPRAGCGKSACPVSKTSKCPNLSTKL
jgi:hypothetical protein